MYGPTEASILVTLHAVGAGPGAAPPPSPDDLAVLPIGTPLPGSGARLLVLDGAMQPVPVGGVGELFIAGPVLAQGYLGRCARMHRAGRADWVLLAGPPASKLHSQGAVSCDVSP